MNKNSFILGGLLTVAALAGTANVADAYRGDPSTKGPLYSPEAAFQGNDYDAWKKLMEERGRTRVTEVINQENFPRFAEARRLALEGKSDEARKIREELGLGLRNGSGGKDGNGRHFQQR